MTLIGRYYLYILLLITLVSCAESNKIDLSSEQSVVNISCGVAEYVDSSSRTNPTSDSASSRLSFNIGDEIMVIATATTGSSSDDYCCYKLTSQGWATEGEALAWSESTMRFLAYYPTTATPTSFDTPTDQSTAEKIAKADLMRVDATISQPNDNSVELLFARQMAYLEVSVGKYGDTYDADENYITDVKIYDYVVGDDGVATTAAITPYEGSSGVYSALIKGTSGLTTPPDYTLITFRDAKGAEYYVENTTYLQPRYKHTISMLVGGDREGVTIESVEVTPWDDPIYIEGGDFNVTDVDSERMIAFSDSDLKQALVNQHNYTLPTGEWADVIDINGNGEIEFEEAAAVTQVVIGVDYDPESYEDLYRYFGGISEFRHLKEIGTMAGDLDLSYLPNLETLNLLATTSRESYDLSVCPYLKELYLFATPATTSVDLRGCRYISDLKLRVEGVSSLDLSNMTSLEQLHIEDTPLSSLDLGANTMLSTIYIESSTLSDLDLSNSTRIKSLSLETNKSLRSLNLSGLVSLETLYCNVADAITSIDLSKFVNLRSLHWGYTGLESISLDTNSELTYLRLEESKITELDISNNTKLSEFLARYVERLTISESQSISPGVEYWSSKISIGGVVVNE